MKVWVTRDRDGVCMWTDESMLIMHKGLYEAKIGSKGALFLDGLSNDLFEDVFKKQMPMDSCKQYEIELKEIE